MSENNYLEILKDFMFKCYRTTGEVLVIKDDPKPRSVRIVIRINKKTLYVSMVTSSKNLEDEVKATELAAKLCLEQMLSASIAYGQKLQFYQNKSWYKEPL